MSRSYKKNPYFKETYGTKNKQLYKRVANKKVRTTEYVPDNSGYKKVYSSYSIADCNQYVDWEDFYENWMDTHVKLKNGIYNCRDKVFDKYREESDVDNIRMAYEKKYLRK